MQAGGNKIVLRVSELTNLKLPNVDLERGQINITRNGNKEQYHHLNNEAVKALLSYLLEAHLLTRLHQKAPFVIKELAGHKSLNTTMRYIKIENKEQAEARDRLEFGAMNL